MKLGSEKLGTITRGRASICTGAGGEGIVVYARLLLLAGSDDGRLAHLKMSDATPLQEWSGFKLLHVTSPCPSGN